ncbi:lysine transporter LysE [Priestia megaterium]|nr:lysine transporter LysE [Priestia megaterium]
MNLTAFLFYVIITSITPGPSNLLIMNEARYYGLRRSMRFNSGIITGFVVLGLVTTFLTSKLYHWLPLIEPYFKIIGAVYLMYLAWKIAFSSKKKAEDGELEIQSSFLSGLLFQVLNVKSILYFLTTMSTFILPYSETLKTTFLFIFLTIFLGCLCLLLWAVFGSVFKKIFVKYDKQINIVMSILLIYCAIEIF